MKKKEKLKKVIKLDSNPLQETPRTRLNLNQEIISDLSGASNPTDQTPMSYMAWTWCILCTYSDVTKPAWCDLFSPGEDWSPCKTIPGRHTDQCFG